LSHYYEESKTNTSCKSWDYNPEEYNLEDGVLILEQMENDLINDDNHVGIPPPSTAMIPLTDSNCSNRDFMFSSTSIYKLPPTPTPLPHHVEAHEAIVVVQSVKHSPHLSIPQYVG
jgi:hypothetical protein